ncbi:chemotaxis protein CheW [Halogeometricum sp. S1BR25-6]|uniref:Chemotaxis protein CheW n=1 Tax=Halogeometricum salsisoli TaxID=2950536 RepID=A0ABU2GCR4_9EURY|nr:chemotaxis protein CheW [Halogeometricum sp. S1BR25-6]MDS0298544.1 chemotaxis protein CheW [Halogeometricum sp. S1BR25-6]
MSQEPQTAAVPDADEAEDVREIQVLEFKLGGETYCVDIEYVSEIVDRGSLTAVPNAPAYVDGVMDLRGRTTSIVNPKALLNLDTSEGESKRIVIFDSSKFEDDAAVGWLVDEVYQVVRVAMDDIEEPPLEKDDSIEGVIKRDGELVIWISPVDAVAAH